MKQIVYFLITALIISIGLVTSPGCGSKSQVFQYISEQTDDCIGVYGSSNISEEQFNRAYNDVKEVMAHMHSGIRKGLLNSGVVMMVVTNERELEDNIDFFVTMLPGEAIFTDIEGQDETLVSPERGVSSTRLELMYLVVYYSLLTEPKLSHIYVELRQAYDQASEAGLFIPGEAYRDGYTDDIHPQASENNALKYGSYLFGLYTLYFGNDMGNPGEFAITRRDELKERNSAGFEFMKKYLDMEP